MTSEGQRVRGSDRDERQDATGVYGESHHKTLQVLFSVVMKYTYYEHYCAHTSLSSSRGVKSSTRTLLAGG